VSPAEFIPIAEDGGMIVSLGAWALLEATTQLRRWIDEETCPAESTMSVNVSPKQLEGDGFLAIVREALKRSRLPAENLWLEVTESMMIDDPDQALRTLQKLADLGVRVALDDFGTGYSSLSLLQRFPLQRIKIDRAFVNNVAEDGHDRALVRTILAMGESLGLEVVAEGVETIQQLDVLTELGCTHVQGYLISRPVHANAMRSTLSALAGVRDITSTR
jgi:EAL domain-containing protein (putative c-di-GMP-specific phosphodiesterase class I)